MDAKYVIVGGGMTGSAALKSLRAADPSGTVALFGAERDKPYARPPLTKGLWKDQSEAEIWRDVGGAEPDLHLDRRIARLDPGRHVIVDDRGEEHRYVKLLLATGGTPRRLGPGADDRILYYRTLGDYRRLRELAAETDRIAVIGGGFIGSEIAAALAMNGKQVTLWFPGDAIGDRLFPADLAATVNDAYRKRGVDLRPRTKVELLERRGESIVVHAGGQTAAAGAVVAGLGIEPATSLAQDAGLMVRNGIVVGRTLRTSDPDIFAAGDVAEFEDALLGVRRRVEHEDNANEMGALAGRNMAGGHEPYEHSPFFYSDLFDLGYEAVGETDPRLRTVADWTEPGRTGVIYYLDKDQRVRGVLLWGIFGKVDEARRVIADSRPVAPSSLAGRIAA
jgi:3-phenylpropionate/trans-cinnamate dioxygenase ferredoxin reductase component